MKKLEEIELFELDTLDNIAIVDYPAIQVDFLCFSAEKNYTFADTEKHIITGPFLIPDLRILRYDANGKPYNIFFSKETVERIAYSFLSHDQIHAFNLGHVEDTDKLTLIESWIKTGNSDKSVELGIDVPVGTWLGSVKVNDKAIWEDIKAGKYNGFSIAGLFRDGIDETDKLLEQIRQIIIEYDK